LKKLILYLDSSRYRPITRALLGHGDVVYAADVNQALKEVVANEFDYFFVDADTPHARAFLEHLSHDPQLPPPSGRILLTGNDEEDCEAWNVDTFVKRDRVKEDIPYIFSHLKRPRGEEVKVLRIAPGPDVYEDHREASKTTDEHEDLGERSHEEVSGLHTRACQQEKDLPLQTRSSRRSSGTVSWWYRIAALALLLAAAGLWVFTNGPLSSSGVRKDDRKGLRKVEAESSVEGRAEVPKASDSAPPVSSEAALSSEAAQQVSAPVQVDESSDPSAGPGDQVSGDSTEVPIEAAPTPTSNRQPGVSISGPSQVIARQVAAFSANASDPDGDALTFSWGSSTTTRCWNAPGLYSVTVTVTDGRGGSASATMSVRVI
jgi:hypothetical protein